jgi:hypothetical protein
MVLKILKGDLVSMYIVAPVLFLKNIHIYFMIKTYLDNFITKGIILGTFSLDLESLEEVTIITERSSPGN